MHDDSSSSSSNEDNKEDGGRLFAKWKLNVLKKQQLLFDHIILRKNIKYFNSYITPDHTYTLTHLTFYNFALNIETRSQGTNLVFLLLHFTI